MEQHPFEEAAEGRGRALSRRDLLAATGGVVLAGSLAGNAAHGARGSAAAKPKRGGTFRLGVTGGGAKDFIDGQSITTKPDQARLTSGWETLLSYDRNYKLGTDALAAEATQDNAKQWTIRLKGGIEFHNGKTLSADDVIYSLRRIADPKNKLFGSAGLASVDLAKLKKMDKLTVRMPLQDGGLDDRRAARPVLQRHRPRRLLAHQQAEVGRHGPVHHHELLARPPERAQPQPELLAHAGSRTSTASG